MSSNELIGFIDYTYLNDDNNPAKYNNFLEQAALLNVACLCVYPKNIQNIHHLLPNKNLATVINFPAGDHSLKHIQDELQLSKAAKEIDVVFPYQLFINNQKNEAFEQMDAILKLFPKDKVIKVIIESGAYPAISDIKEVCDFLIKRPIHFIKTSTGKIKQGASLEAAKIILDAVKDTSIGLKVSGGIKNKEQAMAYFALVAKQHPTSLTNQHFRIGASKIF